MGNRLAAIDVGSNAIRFVLGELVNKKNIEIIQNYRVPIRLGADSFAQKTINDQNIKKLLRAFIGFQKLMIKYDVKYYKAVATSALRDAKNKEEILDLIFATSHIQLDIIDGREEARLVHLGVSHVINLSKRVALLMDVGGGSVEFIISVNGKIRKALSLDMGTIRLLNKFKKYKDKDLHDKIKKEIHRKIIPLKKYRRLFLKNPEKQIFIGTGGNIKSLNRLSSVLFAGSSDNEMTFFEVELLGKIIQSYSNGERIRKLKLRVDRADVILPASIIATEVMEVFGFKKMRAPNVGLKDGILIQLAHS